MTGLPVGLARIGLGTNRLRHTRKNVRFIRAAVEAGVQMIDTAHLYAGGESEDTIGEALSPMPADVLVATKAGFGGAGHGRPEILRREIDESFRRLRTDRIRLCYLHRVDPETPIEESLGTIKEYVDRGQIEHVGISQVGVEEIERARRVVPIAAVQNHYNLSERKFESVVDYCTAEGITFVPYFPLHDIDSAEIRQIARRHRTTTQQIALAWLVRRSPVMLPIPGTLSLQHLRQNLAAVQIQLSDAEFEALQ